VQVSPYAHDEPAVLSALSPPAVRLAMHSRDATEVTREEWRRTVELLTVAFNGGPGWTTATEDPIDHLVWKLVDFPGATRAFFGAAAGADDGALLGFAATLSRRWLLRGHPRLASDIVDAALHPSMQGRVLLELARGFQREIAAWPEADFAFGFASHPASLRNRRFQGRHDLHHPLDTHVRPLDLLRFVRGEPGRRTADGDGPSTTRAHIEATRRRARPTLARYLAWQGRITVQRLRNASVDVRPQSPFTIATQSCFDERVEDFLPCVSPSFDLIQYRDCGFLNWRYTDARAGAFVIRVAEEQGRMLGYAVLRTGHHLADIADLLVLPGRLDVAHALIADTLGLARKSGAAAVRSWMIREHPYETILADQGFVRVRTSTKPVFHARPGSDTEELAFLRDPSARIHLMLGDSDHV